MILEAVFNLVGGLIKIIFGWINLPDFPASVTSVVDQLFALISGSIGLLSVFVDMDMVKILLPLLLVVINFEEIWKFTMFIVKKIPFLGIH